MKRRRLALFLKLKIISYASKHSALKTARKFKLRHKAVKSLIKQKEKHFELADNYPWKFPWKDLIPKKSKFNQSYYPKIEKLLFTWVKKNSKTMKLLTSLH